MEVALGPPVPNVLIYDFEWMDNIILQFAEFYEVSVLCSLHATMTEGMALASAAIIAMVAADGNRMNVTFTDPIGVPLRRVWPNVRDKLAELYQEVFMFLRSLNPVNYIHAFELLMDSKAHQMDLLLIMLEILVCTLKRDVSAKAVIN